MGSGLVNILDSEGRWETGKKTVKDLISLESPVRFAAKVLKILNINIKRRKKFLYAFLYLYFKTGKSFAEIDMTAAACLI